MRDGFFPLHRKFFDHWLWSESRVFSRAEAWIDLMAMAAISDCKRTSNGITYDLKRGQVIASERFLAKRWRWSRSKYRSFISTLKHDHMCSHTTARSTATGTATYTTTITLLNYET